MSDKKHFLTQQSLDKFKNEYQELKLKKIPAIADKINEAKAQGDLSENAEYHEAKEEMAWAQGRLMELEQIISNAEVVAETSGKTDKIEIGSSIKVKMNDKDFEFTIVGAQEADPFNGKISNESPLGQSLIGSAKGDEVEVETPGGIQKYKILEIK